MNASPEIQQALARGWKPSACELIDAGSHKGYESPDGRWFLTAGQVAHMIRTGCEPSEVPTATVLPD